MNGLKTAAIALALTTTSAVLAQDKPASEPEDGPEAAAFGALRLRLTDEIDRAATDAFSGSFLLAAAFALAALLPIALSRRRVAL